MSVDHNSKGGSPSCPFVSNITSLENYDECPVRTIGTCDKWRLGHEPDYTEVNAKYLLQKSMKHAPDSLEKAVENIVKSWEAEIQHKLIPEQIDTIDQKEFSMATNNKTPWKIEDIIRQGTYCCLLEGMSHPALDNKSFEQSNSFFQTKFKTGFAWEVVKVFSGPPKVVFSWRHWAHMGTNSLTEEMDGKGTLIELEGFTRANVSDDGKMKASGDFVALTVNQSDDSVEYHTVRNNKHKTHANTINGQTLKVFHITNPNTGGLGMVISNMRRDNKFKLKSVGKDCRTVYWIYIKN